MPSAGRGTGQAAGPYIVQPHGKLGQAAAGMLPHPTSGSAGGVAAEIWPRASRARTEGLTSPLPRQGLFAQHLPRGGPLGPAAERRYYVRSLGCFQRYLVSARGGPAARAVAPQPCRGQQMPDKTKKASGNAKAKAGATEKPTGVTVATEQTPRGLDAFLQGYRFTAEEFEMSGLDWAGLCEIKAHHESRTDELRSAGKYFWERLEAVPCVHSVRIRVKHPDHLLAKIIRKRLEDPSLVFTIDTYEELITDLIALRALHRFKDEWSEIHKFVISNWERLEPIVAYVREGDEETEQFKQAGCEVKKHNHGYRSIHYLLKSQPANCLHRVELQVRTIFEEAWSEIDHVLRYPRQSFDPTLTAYLVTFNRLCGLGDEMGTYAKILNTALRSHGETIAELERRHQATEEELRAMVSQVEMGEKERAKIQKQMDELQERSQEVRSAREMMVTGTNLNLSNIMGPTVIMGASFDINPDSLYGLGSVSAGRWNTPRSVQIAQSPICGTIVAATSTCRKCGKPLPAGEITEGLCQECKK